MTVTSDLRLSSPAAHRNRDPILDVLRTVLPTRGTVLEVASGSGEHIIYFARHFPDLTWQPSDPSPVARRSITAWVAESQGANILPVLDLEASAPLWPIECADAILAINMVHISPWAASMGLLQGANRILRPSGLLLLYGPYRRAGEMVPSNLAFDADLRRRNAEWGIRDLEQVEEAAVRCGLYFQSVIEMPANNLSVVFRKKDTLISP